MKNILCLLIIVLLAAPLVAGEINEHSFSMNVGGPLSIATFEYEFEFITVDKMSMSFTAGVGSLVLGYSFPVGLTYTYGNENQLLLGVHYLPSYFDGGSLFGSSSAELTHSFTPRIGVRKIFKVSHEMAYFQVYLSPVFNAEFNGVIPWGGIGFGVYL